MKFYLSSFRTGNETEKLQQLSSNSNNRVAFISNAMDYIEDLEFRNRIENNDKSDLEELGFEVHHIDLRDYFDKEVELKEIISEYDIIWCSGGNAFVLIQAMKLSGLGSIIKDLYKSNKDIIYGGFSAGTYILGPTLKGMHLVDDQNKKPYEKKYDTIWEGLGILDYVIVPHYKSDHFESEAVEESIQYLIDNKILFKALRDGEVIIIE